MRPATVGCCLLVLLLGAACGSGGSGSKKKPLPSQVTNPSPADGSIGVAITASISWDPSPEATDYSVYFGTGSPGAFQGIQTATTFDPGSLSNSTRYFWRIDANNSRGTTTGSVWTFDTIPPQPGPASNPSPPDGATAIPTSVILLWDPGLAATSYDVYFGTSSPGAFLGNQTVTFLNPGPLTISTPYFWRIDPVNTGGTTTGAVWTFDTFPPPPPQASNPSPVNEAGDVSLLATLAWDPVPTADSYDVYFWVSGPVVFQGNQTATSFDPGLLTLPERYYWRIDTVNAGGTTTGILWTFTTGPRGEDRTLVIDNLQSPISQAIAAYYIGLRPSARLFSIDTAPQETVNRSTFETEIRDPIESYLSAGGLEDEIWYIVTTKGVPLRISGASGGPASDQRSSVDSELTHMFVRFPSLPGWQNNPYYSANARFSRPSSYNMYLVCRLTGYETDIDLDGIPDDVKDLIDRGVNPVPGATARLTGKFVLDEYPPGAAQGNNWMASANFLLQTAGLSTVHDATNTFLTGEVDLLGYVSWGSNDGSNNTPPYTSMHQYIPGALVTTYVSTNARSFQTGTTYGQSLVADLIQEGVTGANGHVYEPYLQAVSHPEILFERYTRGWNLAESYYASVQYYSWMNVVVGDPLCSPW